MISDIDFNLLAVVKRLEVPKAGYKTVEQAEQALLDLLVPDWADRLGPPRLRAGEKAPHYMAWLRSKPCVVCGGQCDEVHHEPPKGMGGGGSSDYETVPLCKKHHDMRHGKIKVSQLEATNLKREIEEARFALLLEYVKRRECK